MPLWLASTKTRPRITGSADSSEPLTRTAARTGPAVTIAPPGVRAVTVASLMASVRSASGPGIAT